MGADREEGRRQRALRWMRNTGEERDDMKRSNMVNQRKDNIFRKKKEIWGNTNGQREKKILVGGERR